MNKIDVLADPVEDEDVIELTEEIESEEIELEDEELIDLTDGIDAMAEETAAPDASPIEIPTAGDSAPFETGPYTKESESIRPLSIEELTIDSLDGEMAAVDIDAPSDEPSLAAAEVDIDLDLDRLIPETPAASPSSMDAPAAAFGQAQDSSAIFLDDILTEEPADPSTESLLNIGLPLSGEPPAQTAASEPPDGMQPTEIERARSQTAAPFDMTDRISDEQIDRAVERVIRDMFGERISAAIYEVVERVVQDEMDRLRRLLFEEK